MGEWIMFFMFYVSAGMHFFYKAHALILKPSSPTIRHESLQIAKPN